MFLLANCSCVYAILLHGLLAVYVHVVLSVCLSVCQESFISYNRTIIHHSRNYSTKAKCFIVFIGKCIHIF